MTEARVSLSAASKSAMVTLAASSPRRSAVRPARRTRSSRSAPVKRSVRWAMRFEVDVVGERHVLGVDGEDAPAAGGVGHADIDQLVEAAGAKQRRVDQVRPVGRADHDDVLQLLEPVHLGQDGVDHPLGDLRLAEAAAARRARGCRARR